MEFKKKLKIRFYTGISIAIFGAVLIAISCFINHERASSFGLVFLVVGIARTLQYKRITKTADSLHQREISETDFIPDNFITYYNSS